MIRRLLSADRSGRERDPLRGALLRGEAVDVPGYLRRTSPRGWGPWTDAVVSLPELGQLGARWYVEDPIAVGHLIISGPIDEDFTEIEHIGLRPVRFKSEAFWTLDAQIVVLNAERVTTELAVAPPLTDPLLERLLAHLPTPEVQA